MVHIDFFLITIKDMKKKKFSTLLTTFAIALGILSIFIILSINQNFNESIESQLEQLGANKIFVQKAQDKSLVFDDSLADEIEGGVNIEQVYGYALTSIQARNAREYSRVSIVASDLSEEFFKENTIEVEYGQFVSSNSKYGIVIGPLVAKEEFSKELGVGNSLEIEGVKFKIVGIAKELGSPEDDSQVYVQYDTLKELGLVEEYDLYSVIISNTNDVENTKLNLELFFEKKFGEDKVDVLTTQDILNQLNQITGFVTAVLGGIGVISLIVGALGVINTMFVLVTEKVKEIGILKSVGAQNRDVLLLFMFQSSIFGFLGAVIGVVIGSLGLLGIGSLLHSLGYSFLEVSIPISIVVQMIVFGVVIGGVSGFLPSFIASRMNVVDALRK